MTPEQRKLGVLGLLELALDTMGTPDSEAEAEAFSLTMHLLDLDDQGLAQAFAVCTVVQGAAKAEADRRAGR